PRAVAGDLEAEHISEVILNRVLVYPSVSVAARALSALQLISSLASCQNVAGRLAFGRRNAKFGRLTQTSLPRIPYAIRASSAPSDAVIDDTGDRRRATVGHGVRVIDVPNGVQLVRAGVHKPLQGRRSAKSRSACRPQAGTVRRGCGDLEHEARIHDAADRSVPAQHEQRPGVHGPL